MYASALFRSVVFGPIDAAERLSGRRPELVPPRRLNHVGFRGDFVASGQRWRQRLIEDYGLRPDDDVVDIGCGVGKVAVALTDYLEPGGGSYEGFDVVPRGIRWCQEKIAPRYPHFHFRVADVHSRQYNPLGGDPAAGFTFPYADGSFDFALALSLFTHMRPDGVARYLREAARVLRPGGRLVATYFLVDEEVERLLAEGTPEFALGHELADRSGTRYWATEPGVPEYNLGQDAAEVRRMYEQAGLRVTGGLIAGRWSGRRTAGRRPDYQDLLVAEAI